MTKVLVYVPAVVRRSARRLEQHCGLTLVLVGEEIDEEGNEYRPLVFLCCEERCIPSSLIVNE
jgi:hypothetical protein